MGYIIILAIIIGVLFKLELISQVTKYGKGYLESRNETL